MLGGIEAPTAALREAVSRNADAHAEALAPVVRDLQAAGHTSLRALASDPAQRYPDAGEFGDALRRAIRNYESAKVASRAQEKLVALDSRVMSADGGYQRLAAMMDADGIDAAPILETGTLTSTAEPTADAPGSRSGEDR